MNGFWTLIGKDLRLEIRTGQSTVAMLALALLVLVVLVFSFDPAFVRGPQAAAGALWVAMVFAGMLGASRAIGAENENGCFRALMTSPLDRATVYIAKLAVSVIFMSVALVAGLILVVLFFNLEFSSALIRLVPSLILGIAGFAAVATLLAAVSARARGGELLLPLLIVPIFTPALIAGVKSSGAALAGLPLAAASDWIGILVAFDILFITAGFLLFEHAANIE